MLILWYLFVGGLWLLLLAMIFSDAFETPFKKNPKTNSDRRHNPSAFHHNNFLDDCFNTKLHWCSNPMARQFVIK